MGVKRIEQPDEQKPGLRRERRHIRQHESHQETYDISNSKHIVQCEDPHGIRMIRRADKIAHETSLEAQMQHKRPLSETLADMRNGIGIRALGDKCYKHPEYSDNFFYGNELIIGSGFVRGSYPKTKSRHNMEMDMAEFNKNAARSKPKPFHVLEAQRKQYRFEAAVSGLVDWERTVLKEEFPEYQEPSDS